MSEETVRKMSFFFFFFFGKGNNIKRTGQKYKISWYQKLALKMNKHNKWNSCLLPKKK